ncbi:hypothetical protein H2204_005534 [Knufia peltigerae]|uniref:Uncharacterized protein n=1 Tax=Knufia peltigerae TaxID=1002370 RepID=A0AA39CZN5_9EURO|nr:hypothetical protein H2204_005534 [Knufia peltigerae]
MSYFPDQQQNISHTNTNDDQEGSPMTRFNRDGSPLFFPSPTRDRTITAGDNDDNDADVEYEDESFNIDPLLSFAPVAATGSSFTDIDPYHEWNPHTVMMNAAPAPLTSSTMENVQMISSIKKRKRASTPPDGTETSYESGVLLPTFAPPAPSSSSRRPPAVPVAPAARGAVEVIVIDSSDDESAPPAAAAAPRVSVRRAARARVVAPAFAAGDDDDDDDVNNGGNATDSSATSGSSTGSAWDRKYGMKPWPGMTTQQQLSLMDRQKYYYGQEGTPLPPNRPYKPCPNLGDVKRKAEKRERRAKRAALKAARAKDMARK